MTQFLGTHVNRLDAKGRVSIPAPFRAALRNGGPKTDDVRDQNGLRLILRPSHKQPSIEGWPAAAFDELDAPMQRLDMFSDDQDDLAFALYADAAALEPDKEGRIVLPADLAAHAGLGEAVVFVGLGRKFEIWEPAALERRRAEARARTKARGLTLPGNPAERGQP
ncbi:division/cell wall cluster transcriptional repressor MraZ [Limobrevibacterium gyesilva]|uniref:Transcriptional regulator MraZ n=1 Tax=Limobrevibacterium gyesilva TaxID=2991712 RepID=A0AA41YSV9_9PROT|nr:division/cell wall cluster transcriptional repressor MraZ [Limobrevibacterium gyesilva]MCW3475885.1 division/cell wall cluster transcriptional repressor MraZ [Limobrevibacterium gyesilva]